MLTGRGSLLERYVLGGKLVSSSDDGWSTLILGAWNLGVAALREKAFSRGPAKRFGSVCIYHDAE